MQSSADIALSLKVWSSTFTYVSFSYLGLQFHELIDFLFNYFFLEGFRNDKEDDDEKCNMDTISQCIVGFVYIAADTSTVNTCW